MRKLQTWLILGSGVWCLAILMPTLASAVWIRLIFAPICHQMPERSFWLFGKPLAVCVRCSGFYFGFFIALILHMIFRIPARSGAVRMALFVVLLDAANSFLGVYPDLPVTRFAFAFLFSIVVAPFVVQGLHEAIQLIGHTEVECS